MTALSLSAPAFLDVFGSWANVNSGLIGNTLGSAIGVFGAYWVASHQIRQDRATQRRATGAAAAAEVFRALQPVRREVNRLRRIDPEALGPHDGLANSVVQEWHTAFDELLVTTSLRAHLLPEAINRQLLECTGWLHKTLAHDVDWVDDETSVILGTFPAKPTVLDQIAKETDRTERALRRYIRDGIGDHREHASARFPLRKRR